ncbi:hypothetical protein CDL15_Pgr012873 [Punica granatum]|uniref:Uncharacterized protein n=1 Tax=Punica granatum TaxID=22663 RepID=A0A218XGC7_PUNGR|nr:hypothetical protein CDL15_Pgr012873 [Punica granatum]PKI48886.1 hypothetical protein CRG98_030734 [Punica granatum]
MRPRCQSSIQPCVKGVQGFLVQQLRSTRGRLLRRLKAARGAGSFAACKGFLTAFLPTPSRVEEVDRQEGNHVEDEALPHEEAKQYLNQEPFRHNLEDFTHTDSKVGVIEVSLNESTSGILRSQSSHHESQLDE